MFCKECGERITNEKAVICTKCGMKRGQGNNFCHECGKTIANKEGEVCLNCGVRLKSNISNLMKDSTNNNNTSKIIAGLLAIFVGSLGIHRFYLGYNQIGIIQLGLFLVGALIFPVVILVPFVWGIVDTVMIFTNKLTNVNGQELV